MDFVVSYSWGFSAFTAGKLSPYAMVRIMQVGPGSVFNPVFRINVCIILLYYYTYFENGPKQRGKSSSNLRNKWISFNISNKIFNEKQKHSIFFLFTCIQNQKYNINSLEYVWKVWSKLTKLLRYDLQSFLWLIYCIIRTKL